MHEDTWKTLKKPIIGIQGGLGSFNEAALKALTTEENIEVYETKYLYTTENVFKALESKHINLGIFAIHNSVGGIVEESLEAISKHVFKVCREINIPIQHFLMKKPGIPQAELNTIMAHPQVFSQCKNTLTQFPQYNLVSGDGNLIDTAEAAKALSEGIIPETTAILGPKVLSEIYNFDVIEENLQDDDKNITSFLLVQSR